MANLRSHREVMIAIRGDIISSTGYAKAARAMAKLLADRYIVVGVSEHEDPSDCGMIFPGDLIKFTDLVVMAKINNLFVVHHTTPDNFIYVPYAVNIGAFYWETTAIPRRHGWSERMAGMDAIWAPTRFVERFVRSCGYDGPIALIPWPHEFEPPPPPRRSPGAHQPMVEMLPRMPVSPNESGSWWTQPLDRLFGGGDAIYLAIQSLAPRKGLPILISEWCRFIASVPETSSTLVLKLSFRHAHGISADPRGHLVSLLARFGVEPGQPLRIALLNQHLDDHAMSELIASSGCLISTSLGEGFGGPIVEALIENTPVMAPRHTGIADLLPPDYPLRLSFSESAVQLRDAVDIYPPSSTWCLPDAGSLAGALRRFEDMPASERSALTAKARHYARAFCGIEAVQANLYAEVDRLIADATP